MPLIFFDSFLKLIILNSNVHGFCKNIYIYKYIYINIYLHVQTRRCCVIHVEVKTRSGLYNFKYKTQHGKLMLFLIWIKISWDLIIRYSFLATVKIHWISVNLLDMRIVNQPRIRTEVREQNISSLVYFAIYVKIRWCWLNGKFKKDPRAISLCIYHDRSKSTNYSIIIFYVWVGSSCAKICHLEDS